MTFTQWSPPFEGKFTVQLTEAEYKLYRRLKSLNYSCEVHVYLDDKGNVKSLRVMNSKEEDLT